MNYFYIKHDWAFTWRKLIHINFISYSFIIQWQSSVQIHSNFFCNSYPDFLALRLFSAAYRSSICKQNHNNNIYNAKPFKFWYARGWKGRGIIFKRVYSSQFYYTYYDYPNLEKALQMQTIKQPFLFCSYKLQHIGQ